MSLHLLRALISVSLLMAVLVLLPFWSVQLHDQSFLQDVKPAEIKTSIMDDNSNFFIFSN